jgi:transposase
MDLDAVSAADSLPDDLETCRRELQLARQELHHAKSTLAETAVICEEQGEQIQALREELELLKRFVFGRRSERMVESPAQGRLFASLDEKEASDASLSEAEEEEITYRRRRGHGWSKLPEHLPREEVLVDLPAGERQCPCCGEEMTRIGEDRSERVDYRPAEIVVKVIVRPKYACPKKHGVQQAEASPSPVPGGRFDFGFVAGVLTSKFADHLPLYRQQDVLARSGLELSRSTMCDMLASAAMLLTPLAVLLRQRVLAEDVVGADDTPVRLLDPSHPEGVRTARFWLYYGYGQAPYDVFQFHESRSRDGPKEFLKDFSGWAKVDAYGVQDGVYLDSKGRIRASCCWAHARRKFHEASSSHPRKSAEALAMIRQLYDVEDRARELAPELRRELRQQESAPILDRMKAWLDQEADTALPKSKFGEAVRYARNQWEELVSYLSDGRLPIDNNNTEGELRRLTIGRKNWLFIGAPEAGPRAAIIYTIVASAARHDLDIWAYLCDVLKHLATGEEDLAALLPDAWAKSHPEAIRTFRAREREAQAKRKRERRRRRRLQRPRPSS